MPEETNPPRPHGDKLKHDELKGSAGQAPSNPDDNQAQVKSDASADVVGETGAPVRDESDRDVIGGPGAPVRQETDRDRGPGSTANGIPAFDEDEGGQRRRQYKDGADLVSGVD
jgi:hypothetical protein